MKKFLFASIAILLPITVVIIIGEIYVRLHPSMVDDPIPPTPYDTRVLDNTLGWHVKGNYSWQGEMNDFGGNKYSMSITTNALGFRSYPNHDDSTRLKIFLVGDSYTESVEMGDSNLFYNILRRELPVDIYAYGSAGYGTMQEFLILQKYFDSIKPDIVILQLCSNDFSDNYCGLERETNYKVGQRRPYMNTDGKVFYDRAWMPHKHLREYSNFLYYLSVKFDNAKANMTKVTPTYPGEGKIVQLDSMYEPFRQSTIMTSAVLGKMGVYLDNKATFLAFTSDHWEPAMTTLKRICEKNGIEYLDGVGTAVQNRQNSGEVVRAYDGYHWNSRGHEIVAAVLKEKLEVLVQQKIDQKNNLTDR